MWLFLVWMGVIEIVGDCKYALLIFNIKEVMRMFGVCKYPFLTWLVFSMNGVTGNVWGIGKNFKVCKSAFFNYLKVTSKQGVPEVSIIHFWPTMINRW